MNIFLKILTYLYLVYFLGLLIVLIMLIKHSFFAFRKLFKGLRLKNHFILFVLVLLGFLFRIKYSFHIDLDPYGWRYIQDSLAIKGIFYPSLSLHFQLSDALHVLGYSFFAFIPLLFSNNIFAVSVFNIGFSVLTIVVVYLITYLWTQNKSASALAAGMLTASLLHIVYSGMEFPMSISVFFVALEFLYFILWLRSKNIIFGLVSLAAFFISINIKFENIVFILLYGLVSITSLKDVILKEQFKRFWKYFTAIFAFSVLIWIPFIINFQYLQVKSVPPSQHLYSLGNFWEHFWLFVVEKYRGFPLFMVLAFFVLNFFKKSTFKGYVLTGWFFVSLLLFSWCAAINSEWNMLQILIPTFIISGYVISETVILFFKNKTSKYIILFLVLFILFWNAMSSVKEVKRYSWVNLKEDLDSAVDEGCIISLDIRTSKFSLNFLFPDRNWIFLENNYQNNDFSQCKDKLYYFNPVPYGLEEEADKKAVLRREDRLREKYEFEKVSKFALYTLKKE